MPGLTLSSNWKKLQETLQSGEQQGTKRKRLESNTVGKDAKSSNGIDTRYSPRPQPAKAPVKRRKMGLNQTRPSSPPPTTTSSTPATRPPSRASSTKSLPNKTTFDLINQGAHPTHKPGKFIALDCEMVGIGADPSSTSLLARVSLVNYHGEQLYDSYVQPSTGEEITDYRTHVSGIRPEHLVATVARPFAEVQTAVATLLDGKVLVGHALRNDLAALMLGHPKRDIRDTARYPGYRKLAGGKTPSLRKLAREVLGQRIQEGEHSSVVDARVAMELFVREREGFEAEVRRRFGTVARKEKGRTEKVGADGRKGAGVVKGDLDEDEDDAGDDDEDGDEDGEDAAGGDDGEADGSKKTQKPKKKKKKKKRTKRA